MECQWCGNEFIRDGTNVKYCPACRHLAHQWYDYQYNHTKRASRKKDTRHYEETLRNENNSNLSWDWFPAVQLETKRIPARNQIGTVSEQQLVTKDNNGNWVRPKAIINLEKAKEKIKRKSKHE